ncbi:unnamed protein product [Prorocentrum cordatum]|uniref:Uncharacterized protein n=1 Tax=Prorocentrum cordatum TaxID=2364126 RepID=A0ABN9V3I0_9DINO|nr:unnamed protein product [Polarella glacialis]|mmetsp:Transcript_5279/g.14162  ORF Transcript_5279/g.14162 Transcript_5279/m.14162 type:complete len:397 (+) Transcript_5279:93-1283(+)
MWSVPPDEPPCRMHPSAPQSAGDGCESKRRLAAVLGVLMATIVVVSLLAIPNMKGAGSRGGSTVPARALQNPDGSDWTVCRQSPERLQCPALDMFDDPAVHQKVIDDLIWSSHEFLGIEARGDISKVVGETFSGIRAKLLTRAPDVAQHVKNLQLTSSESSAAVSAMQLIVDERVQSIGREVAVAMLSSLPKEDYESDGGSLTIQQRDAVLAGLDERLRPRLDDIRKIVDATVSPPLRMLWGEGRQDLLPSLALSSWEMALEPSVVSTLRASSDKMMMVRRLQGNSTLSAPPRNLLTEMTDTGRQDTILGATLMLGRTLLNAMQMYMRLTSNSMAPLSDTYDVTDEMPSVRCKVDGRAHQHTPDVEPHQIALCSFKFGILGADALRATFMADQMTS